MLTLENIITQIFHPDQSQQTFFPSILAGFSGIISLALASTVIHGQDFANFIIKLFFLTILFLFLVTIYLPATGIWLKSPPNYRQVLTYLNWRVALFTLTLPVAIICRLTRLQLLYSLFVAGIFLLLLSQFAGDISRLTQKKPALIVVSFFLPLLVVFCIIGALFLLALIIFKTAF